MIVSKLEIKGFRGVQEGDFNFQTLSTLFGPNSCGKTTITEALALVLGRDRLVRPLTEHDFFGSEPAPEDRIEIVATITDFVPNDPAAHTDWFRWGRGTIKWQDAETGAIKLEAESETDKLTCQLGFAARFDQESLETITVRYFYDGRVDPFDEENPVIIVPRILIQQIGFFLVPASRTWDRTISFGSELFRRVVSYVGGKPAAAVLAERERLRHPEQTLESDQNLEALVREIDTDIAALFGKPLTLKLRVTSTDSASILEAIMPHFAGGEGLPIPSRRHGSGLVSFQTLILLMRFGRLRMERGDGFLMVVEEPELHVPPPLQRKLLRMLQSMAPQTIVTTHSPTVAAVPEAHQISLIVNEGGRVTGRPLSRKPLAADAVNPIRSLLLTDRDATVLALMHRTVIIPEGKTDANWLRLFVKTLELSGDAASESGLRFANEVGVAPTKDARCAEVFTHLHAIHPNVVCLFDGDRAGDEYTASCCKLPDPPSKILRWPNDWAIESVVAWVVAGDMAILANAELAAAGVPQQVQEFSEALAGDLKTDEIIHSRLADAMISSQGCRRRIAHMLGLLCDLAAGRPVDGAHAAIVRDANNRTEVWTVKDDVHGI